MNTFEDVEPTGLMQPKIRMFFEFVHVYHIDTMKVVHPKRSSRFNRKIKNRKKVICFLSKFGVFFLLCLSRHSRYFELQNTTKYKRLL